MWVKILLLFFVFSFLFKTDHSFDQDLGRHLKLGEIIVKDGSVPKTNLFSYTNPDFTFINTHWLFEVLVYWASQTIGLKTVLVIKVIIFIASVWLVLKMIPKENQALLLPVGFIFLHVLRERLDLRPEIFSFLFTAITYYILNRFKSDRQKYSDRDIFVYPKTIFLLPVIQLLWINTHIYFFIGLALQAIFLLHFSYQYLRFHLEGFGRELSRIGVKLKLLAFIFILSVLLSLINPNGLTGFLYPLNVSKNYGYTIVENQTMFLLESITFKDPNFLFAKISLGLVAFSLLIAFFRKKIELKNILIAIFGGGLALMNVRSFPYLVFLSLPAVLLNFGPIKQTAAFKILAIIFGGLLILESYFYLNGDYYRFRDDSNSVSLKLVESSKSAMDFVLNNNLPGPIYNNFDIGSYIIYRGFPKYQVFVDGRPEGYPKEFFLQTYIPMQSDYSKFKDLQSRFGFKTIIFSHTDQTPWGKAFLSSVVKDNDWKIVYLDDFMIVLLKNEIALLRSVDYDSVHTNVVDMNVALQVVDLTKLEPDNYSFNSHVSYLRLALFLAQTGYSESAEKFARAGLALFPESPLANALFGTEVKNKFFW